MDPTSAVRTDTLPAIATVVTPGAFASASYVWCTLKTLPSVNNFVYGHGIGALVIGALIWIVLGLCIDSLASYIEVYCIDRRRKDCDAMLDDWWRFLRTAWNNEPIGLRYLRRLLVTFKFELNLAVAAVVSIPGFLFLAWFGHMRWRILFGALVAVIVAALILFKAAYDSSTVLVKVRSELLKGVGEPPFDAANNPRPPLSA